MMMMAMKMKNKRKSGVLGGIVVGMLLLSCISFTSPSLTDTAALATDMRR